MVKRKDTGEYLYYIYLYTTRKQYVIHKANESLHMRIKWDFNTFYMRCWLRLLRHSQSCYYTLCPSPWYILEVLIVTSCLIFTHRLILAIVLYKVKSCQVQRLPELSLVEFFGHHKIFQISVICPNFHRVCSTFKKLLLFFKSLDNC